MNETSFINYLYYNAFFPVIKGRFWLRFLSSLAKLQAKNCLFPLFPL